MQVKFSKHEFLFANYDFIFGKLEFLNASRRFSFGKVEFNSATPKLLDASGKLRLSKLVLGKVTLAVKIPA